MGAEIIDGAIHARSTGAQPFNSEPVTMGNPADGESTGAQPFDSSPVTTGSHWERELRGATTPAKADDEPETKQVTAAEVEDKSVRPAAADTK